MRGQFAPLWALAKRLSGRGTSKGPRALPVILLPDGSVAQSEADAMEALAAVFTADFGAGARRVTAAELQEQLDTMEADAPVTAPGQRHSDRRVPWLAPRLAAGRQPLGLPQRQSRRA